MINPPSRGKGGHWTNDTLPPPITTEDWLAGAEKHDGSWGSDWTKWLAGRSGKGIKTPTGGRRAYPAGSDAPGRDSLPKYARAAGTLFSRPNFEQMPPGGL